MYFLFCSCFILHPLFVSDIYFRSFIIGAYVFYVYNDGVFNFIIFIFFCTIIIYESLKFEQNCCLPVYPPPPPPHTHNYFCIFLRVFYFTIILTKHIAFCTVSYIMTTPPPTPIPPPFYTAL